MENNLLMQERGIRERERLGGSKQEEMRCGEQVEMLASVF